MTRDELVGLLRGVGLLAAGDPEAAHLKADELLLAYIDDPQVTAAFAEIEKWYA